MWSKTVIRFLLLTVGTVYVSLVCIYTYRTQLSNIFTIERKYQWLNDKINSHLNMDNDEVRSNDLYLRNFREYNNGLVEIDETKVIETKRDVVIYRTHKEKGKTKNAIRNSDQSSSHKKYLFAFRHYEQLGAATHNLLSLASLATHFQMNAVMPFVNNSRFSGFRLGLAISRHMKLKRANLSEHEYDGAKFRNLGTYFDVDHMQDRLEDSGYMKLESYDNFRNECKKLDVIIHFLHNDVRSRDELIRWAKLPITTYEELQRKVRENKGIIDCPLLKSARLQRYLNDIPVDRYVCIDPEMVTTGKELYDQVIKQSKCAAIHSWKGSGLKRTNFDTPKTIVKTLVPSDLKHNKRLIDIAYHFIREIIKRPFISVHVRSERHLMWKTVKDLKFCIQRLSDKVKKRKIKFNLRKIFLANDLEDSGSGTLRSATSESDRNMLKDFLYKSLENPFRFDPSVYNVYDRGEIAIIEMHILSLGESLFTLGRGNFQEWIIDLFLLHNADDRSLIYKTCGLGSKRR